MVRQWRGGSEESGLRWIKILRFPLRVTIKEKIRIRSKGQVGLEEQSCDGLDMCRRGNVNILDEGG